jgi:hypothetical protein
VKLSGGDLMKSLGVVLLALAFSPQMSREPAKDLFMHSAKAPGVEIQFVDYHWQPAMWEAMEKGSSTVPEATRNWVVARVVLNDHPLTFETSRLVVGNYGLVLWPNLDGKGMAVEMRRIDMRDVYPDVNAIAPAPRGETEYKGPTKFEAGLPLAPRFDIAMASDDPAKVTLTIRYGDRRLVLAFGR